MFLNSKRIPDGSIDMSNGTYNISVQKEVVPSPDMISLMKSLKGFEGNVKIALGVDESGKEILFDLNSVPNVIVGGTTGSGKSVLMHNMILSCILSKDVEVVLIDPKRVEFSIYEGFAKTIKSSSDFKEYLCSLDSEMSKRYDIFERFKCRSISEFNMKYRSIRMNPIVVFVDEWADIFMSDHSIQNDLCKIAQKGRASGISFVLATQRPSTDIISGIIKANFPGRIALKVASGHDSRTILDACGAEKITEKGDGFFISGDKGAIRFKTGYIKNIQEVLEWALYHRL
jgi:S-DNA-T family DNA segregation ATPase FtsK/SpoIIIE